VVASVVLQRNRVASPATRVAGLAVKLVTVGTAGNGDALTVTVTAALAVPPGPLAVRV
jgi:hypothetical protein